MSEHPELSCKRLSHLRPMNRNPLPRQPPPSPHRRKQNRLRVVPRRLSQLTWGKKTEIYFAFVILMLMFPILARGVLLPCLLFECCLFLCACCRYYDNTICADIALSSRKGPFPRSATIQRGVHSIYKSEFFPLYRNYRSLQQRLYQDYRKMSQKTTHYTDK